MDSVSVSGGGSYAGAGGAGHYGTYGHYGAAAYQAQPAYMVEPGSQVPTYMGQVRLQILNIFNAIEFICFRDCSTLEMKPFLYTRAHGTKRNKHDIDPFLKYKIDTRLLQ